MAGVFFLNNVWFALLEIREPTGILYLPTKCSYTPVPAQGYEARPFKRCFFILHSPPAEAQEEELKAAEESPEPEEKTDGVEVGWDACVSA